MRKQVTIAFDVPEGMEDGQIKDVVRTALGDYWSVRRWPQDYVTKRYAEQSDRFRRDAQERVELNVALIVTASVGDVAEVPEPKPYYCKLCGQRIDDGKPCGCGAR